LPEFVSRRFHIVTSVLFVVSATTVFFFWVAATLLTRGSVFYSLHGIVGLASIVLIIAGTIMALGNLGRPRTYPSRHGKTSIYGFVLYVLTILLGFALTIGWFNFT
jgi:cytochrome b561